MTNFKTLRMSIFSTFIVFFLSSNAAQSNEPMPVVATFSILGDMVKRIGNEHVAVTTLVGPDGDAHVYQPTPADARAASDAKVLIVNGLEFEGWLDRLVDASGFDGLHAVATKGIKPIAFKDEHDNHDESGEKEKDPQENADAEEVKHEEEENEDHNDHGTFDPHAWQSLKAAVTYIDNITAALSMADPTHAATFYANRAVYVAEIKALNKEISERLGALPNNRRIIVTSHDAFQYFGREYGLTFLAPQGLSTESEASAKDVAHLIEQMREKKISAAFVENIADPRLLKQIANETGASIGGTLFPDSLSGKDEPASTYLDMMRHNAMTIAKALGS